VAIVAAPAPPPRTVSRSNTIFDIPNVTSVLLFGFLDASVPFSYFLHVPSELWQEIALGIKVVICIRSSSGVRLGRLSAFSLYSLAAIVLISYGVGGAALDDYKPVIGFFANLMFTLMFVRRSNLPAYVLACVCTIGISTLLYIVVAQTGGVQVIWGRFAYFGDTEPNLGSEIIAMSVVLATCVLPPTRLLIFAAPSLYAINLMQGRSGLFVSIASLAIKLYFGIERPKTRAITTSILVVVGLVLYLFFLDAVTAYFNALFLIDDEYRGTSTGFTGRDELWGAAWNYFLQSPVIGNGVVNYGEIGVEPHNFFLFGLTKFGMLSFLIFGMIIYLYYDLYRYNRQWLYGLSAIPILWVFNDRFLNLNPYPFLLYVVLFAHADDDRLPVVISPP